MFLNDRSRGVVIVGVCGLVVALLGAGRAAGPLLRAWSGSLPGTEQIADAPGALRIAAGPGPGWVGLADGSAWVSSVGADDGIGRYDRAGNLIGALQAGTEDHGISALDVGFGSLWVVDFESRSVARIDLDTGVLQATIQLPFSKLTEQSAVSAGDGAVFVMADSPHTRIASIDPATNRVNLTFPGPQGGTALLATGGVLWAADGDKLGRFDPSSGAATATVAIPNGAQAMAIGGGSLWLLGERSGDVSRVDPTTNTVTASITISPQPGSGGGVEVGGGYVWARVLNELVAKIDPTTNHVIARYNPGPGGGSLAADDHDVWITAPDSESIWRLPLSRPST
jgi:DNA-binding beta-propeller fold protein YncE